MGYNDRHVCLDSPAFRPAWRAGSPCPRAAQADDPIAAIRADRWADAQREAATYADPVADKLVTYYRMLAPGAATADEITDFMAQSPDWPNHALLERRRQEAIAADPDLASTLARCDHNTLTLPTTLLHCAEALADAGRHGEAAEDARRAWTGGIGDEAGFLRRWSGALRPEDSWARFQNLAGHDMPAANVSCRSSTRSTDWRRKHAWRCSAMSRTPRRSGRSARRLAPRTRNDAGPCPLAAPG